MTRSQLIGRIAVSVIALLAVVAVILGSVGYAALARLEPRHSGEVRVRGIDSPVTVRRDAQGVPQLYADDAEDLFYAQGYVSAGDRFFEMDLRRHVASGRLSELVGSGGLQTDKLIRTLGWRRVAEAELPLLSASTRRYLQSYADGVNAYVRERGQPSDIAAEYLLLGLSHPGYRIEEWSPVDSLVWLKAMAWDLKGNDDDEVDRALMFGSGLTVAQIASLYPVGATASQPPILSAQDWTPAAAKTAATATAETTPTATAKTTATTRTATTTAATQATKATQAALADASRALAALPELIGRGEGVGSNSWVVGPKRSTTGKPLLANDPHLAASQPGVWHQVGLHCTTVSPSCPFDVSGFTFAGVPGVVIGHNARVAWAFTNLNPDVADLYLERATASTYLQDGAQHALSLRTERIAVAGGEEQTLVVRETKHGPIISDVVVEASRAGQQAPVGGRRQHPGDPVPEVSLAWTALRPMRTADGLFALNTAGSFADFRAALKNFSAPSQNVLYADVDGHIGYQAPGDVPIRASATPGTPPGWLPAPGWDSAYDWQGYVPYEQLPWAYDPPEGMIVTANQQVTASPTPFLTRDWTPGWRSSRIRSLLLAQDRVSPDRMREIQLDDLDPLAATFVPLLRRIDLHGDDFTREGQALLEGYDGRATSGRSRDASAAAFYNAVVAHTLSLALDDSLPDGAKVTGGGRWTSVLAGLLQHPDSPWWDDRSTPAVERRDDILARAMRDARLDLTASAGKAVTRWDWGTLHALPLEHPLSAGLPGLVRDVFDRGPVPVAGSGVTVDATGFDQTKGYATTHVPSMRMVVDLAALDSSTWVNLTGVSGHPLSQHYDDQTEAWATGRTFAWPSTPKAVEAAAVDTLVLQPDGSGD